MQLQCGKRLLDLTLPQVMGILNVTPDSFSDGGQFNARDAALRHVEKMLHDGATIVDVGGESTRPGADAVSEAEELERVIPMVEAIAARFDIAISIDTSNAAVMRESALAGAHLLNDVRSLTKEGALESAAATGLPICIMHMNGEPQVMQNNPVYADPIEIAVLKQLQESIERCEQAGIARNRLLIDPGFGFGKTNEHNYQLLNRLESLHSLGLPLLTGLSRKRMIGQVTNKINAADRVLGSVSGAIICALKGSRIVRVHDVRETVEALQVVRATLKEGYV